MEPYRIRGADSDDPALIAVSEALARDLYAVSSMATALAHDMNNELMIVLSSVAGLLDGLAVDDFAVPSLLEIQAAAQRCAGKVASLQDYGARGGAGPSAATIERVIDEQDGIVPEG